MSRIWPKKSLLRPRKSSTMKFFTFHSSRRQLSHPIYQRSKLKSKIGRYIIFQSKKEDELVTLIRAKFTTSTHLHIHTKNNKSKIQNFLLHLQNFFYTSKKSLNHKILFNHLSEAIHITPPKLLSDVDFR